MDMRRWLTVNISVVLVVLLLAVGLTQAQESGGGDVNTLSVDVVTAGVDGRFSIQGYLTDENGVPLADDWYKLTFRLYEQHAGGTPICTDVHYPTLVGVVDGLFTTQIDCGDVLYGQEVWLGIEVEDDGEMAPRKYIYPVPYALSLRAGAVLSDTRDTILTVRSSGSGDADALKVYAGDTGEAIEAYATGGVGLFAASENYVALQAYSYATNTHPAIFGCTASLPTDCDPHRDDASVGVLGYGDSETHIGVAGLQLGYALDDLGLWAHPGGFFAGNNGVIGLGGTGVLGLTDSADGYAGMFTGNGHGVRISTDAGKVGLEVIGGSKNAVVATDDGARLLYTEESTEVWFTDYGFGQLEDGAAVIAMDAVFAQTVNLAEPYHVFIQVYGDAEVYVGERNDDSFTVRLRDGDPDVAFSYRVVGKRLGFESARLDRAPWADDDPNLRPE